MATDSRGRPNRPVRDSSRTVITVEEAAWRLDLSRGSVYRAVKAGDIPYIKIGRRFLIPSDVIDRMLYAEGDQARFAYNPADRDEPEQPETVGSRPRSEAVARRSTAVGNQRAQPGRYKPDPRTANLPWFRQRESDRLLGAGKKDDGPDERDGDVEGGVGRA